MKFFFKDVGTNADIKRHRNKESELRKKIEDLENVQNKTDFEYACINEYRNILARLLESKVHAVDKLGRK